MARITLKSPDEIEAMARAGHVNALALAAMAEAVRPGITTAELDAIGEEVIRSHGGEPIFLNYPNATPSDPPFPAATTISINDELVHGVPGTRKLHAGDIVSIDVGTLLEGLVGDCATTVPVGEIGEEAQRLLEVTEEALRRGIEASQPGNRLGDVSAAIQQWVESNGFEVVREYTGHGVGRAMHEPPQIYNWGRPHQGIRLEAGMTFALEPMVTIGPPILYRKLDGWTVGTVHGGLCAHFEHTLAVTAEGPRILTV